MIRQAQPEDAEDLATFVSFEFFVHRHLDWRTVLDWLSYQPYWVIERGERIAAALAMPADPPKVHWIRLFACTALMDPERAFRDLFAKGIDQLKDGDDGRIVAALAMHNWFRKVLEANHFTHHQDIVTLQWERQPLPERPKEPGLVIRPMLPGDIPAVAELDRQSFESIWQLSPETMTLAYEQAGYATVGELDGELVAYQISNENPLSAHLARIAVRPDIQGKHIGFSILKDLITYFVRQGIWQITVNTQHDNRASLALYQMVGFEMTGERYPVFRYTPAD